MNIDVTLNIHYSAPKEIWNRLGEIYHEMPGWAEVHGEGVGSKSKGSPLWIRRKY